MGRQHVIFPNSPELAAEVMKGLRDLECAFPQLGTIHVVTPIMTLCYGHCRAYVHMHCSHVSLEALNGNENKIAKRSDFPTKMQVNS